MRKVFITLALLLLTGAAWAQYAGTAGTSATTGTEYEQALKKAKSGKNTGIGLTVGGGLALLGGGTSVLVGLTGSMFGAVIGGTVGSIGGEESAQQGAQQGAKAGEPYIIGGLIAAGAGIVSLGVGIPMIVKNKKKLKSLQSQVSLGPTGNGVGLAFRF